MSTNPFDDLAKQLAAAAERERLEAEAKAAETTPEVRGALEKLAQTLTQQAKPTPPAAAPRGTDHTADDKKTQ